MHGIVFLELQRFVTARHGPDAWQALVRVHQLGARVYMPVSTYPDEELQRLVGGAASVLGLDAPAVLRQFGHDLAPRLIATYQNLVRPGWRSLELIENTELLIHTVVRRRTPGAEPPRLHVSRVGAEELLLTYASERRLCALARGLVEGFGAYFSERITTAEDACMLQGAAACSIRIVREGTAAATDA